MRFKRTVLTSVVAAALAVAFGVAPAHAADPDGKPDTNGTLGGNVLAADVATGQVAPTVSPAVSMALSTIQSRIADFVQTHGTKHTFGSYADPASGKIVIETDAPSEVVSSLVGTFAGLVEVRKQTISDISRRNDTPPFYGGAGIRRQGISGAHCSSGYTVRNSAGTRFMITAGHCFSNGQVAVTELGGRVVGTASGNGLPSRDMVRLSGQSYAPRIFTGGVDSNTSAHVASARDPIVGFNNYCHSGRTTGEHCGHTVTSITAQVCTSSGCKQPVIAYRGGTLPQGGDSGAPFYANSVSAPDKHIRGHHIAGGGTSYAELYSRVTAWFGVTIVT